MKNVLVRLAVLVTLTAGLAAVSVQAHAQQPAGDPQQPVAAQQAAPQATDMQAQDAKPFSGTIVKEKGKLVLKDSGANMSYQLDDQDKAQPFEGKQVKVTGKLNAGTKVIHVENIEAAS